MTASRGKQARTSWGVPAQGLGAALLFGLSTPFAKILLPHSDPLTLAAMLYLGAAAGLSIFGAIGRLAAAAAEAKEPGLTSADLPVMAGIVIFGGIAGPILMLAGLERLSAVAGSLLLNLETPFTILLALAVFGDHMGRREAYGAAAIVIGAILLGAHGSRPRDLNGEAIGAIAIAGACMAWAIDNNLTQRLALRDPVAVTRFKTSAAGLAMLAIAIVRGDLAPRVGICAASVMLGTISYGASLILNMRALRMLGAARQAAYFATAPFAGAIAAAIIFGERPGAATLAAGLLMALGAGALASAPHVHRHRHEPLEHEHRHVHDEHHAHPHPAGISTVAAHSHWHRHEPIEHVHPHFPDPHHRHGH
jgi:drug/metabolite transporter (DMT)-like permease